MEPGRFIYKYSRWDGSQLIRTELLQAREQLIEDYLNFGDFRFAFNWMIRQGSPALEFEGLNRLAQRLRGKRAELLSRFNSRSLIEQFNQWLEEILQKEFSQLEELEQELSLASSPRLSRLQELFEKQSFLHQLPEKFHQKLQALKSYQFESSEAKEEFENLLEYFEKLQRFMASNFFSGTQEISLEQAMELAIQLERLEALLRALERGELEGVNLTDLEEFLGRQARQSIERLLEFTEFLKESGFLLDASSVSQLTPRAIRLIGEKALKDIFQEVAPELIGKHRSGAGGTETIIPDQSRAFQFGDPLRLHLFRTLQNALRREFTERSDSASQGSFQLRLKPEDFEVVESERESRSATVLMLDLSLSMFQTGRFIPAKKVALALEHLIRTRFPRDYFYLVGFATYARILTRRELIEATSGLGEDIFTNIQHALELARKLLSRHQNASRQIILITDGQPTAFFRKGKLYIEWPYFGVAPEANQETLKEVQRVTKSGIIINTFMLDRSPPLVKFVEELTRINQGRAFFTSPEHLGKYLLVDFLARKKRIIH